MTTNHYKAMCEALGVAERTENLLTLQSSTATAQVHATAFVGEQARIANLFEILRGRMSDYNEAALGGHVAETLTSGALTIEALADDVAEIRTLIREELGL